jgi:hypothetical protein
VDLGGHRLEIMAMRPGRIWSNNPVRHEAPCDRAEMEGLRFRVVAAA